MARMTQQEIFEILMDLHEVSNNDMMKKVYEICLKCLEDITSEITSVEDLPDIDCNADEMQVNVLFVSKCPLGTFEHI